MNTPLVSIIVPLYNHAQYIEATLESFLHEGYPALEVVILDDGSKDNSFEVAQAWLEAHPEAFGKVICERQSNQGITKTLNRLLALSSGAFITMVASDDVLLPGGIQARLQALQARPDWLAVFADASIINNAGQTTAPSAMRQINRANIQALAHDAFRASELILRWAVPGPVLLSKREAFDSTLGVGGYDETMVIEDRSLYLRLLAHQALGFVPCTVAAYRMHGNNTIKSTHFRRAVYDAVYRSEFQALTNFSGAKYNTFSDAEHSALEFITQRSKMHLLLMDARGLTQLITAACKLAWNSLVLQALFIAHDWRVRYHKKSSTQ